MDALRRAQFAVAIVALIAGVVTLVASLGLPLTSPRGGALGGTGITFNLLGAALVSVLGIVALVGAVLRRRSLVLAAAGGFALIAVQVLLQFGRSANLLGTRGSSLSLALGAAAGLGALGLWGRRDS
ncbi:MAG: hypothetical protein H0W36_15610 [Gemmatimonadetes bacterium]|nr:hypothetical protein [Actinomycetota bacterium]MBA3585910.1 hypothetical protein [Gemmatimonadota bacterium]